MRGTTLADYDRILLAGDVTLDGELVDGFVPAADADFQIFDAGTLSGTFSTMLLPDLPSMLGWDSSDLYSSGTLSAIPEPATLSLLMLGTLMLLRRRR